MKLKLFPPVKALLLSRCSFPTMPGCHSPSTSAPECQFYLIISVYMIPAGSKIILYSLSRAAVVCFFFFSLSQNQKVNTCRVEGHPPARGIKTACGSYSAGNKKRHFHMHVLAPVMHAACGVSSTE